MAYNWSNPIDFGSGFGADTQGQFKDITSFLPTKQGGNMLLAPLAVNAIGPLISAGASLFGVNKAEQAAKRSRDLARENAFGINFQSFLGRQAADAANTNQLAFAIGDRNFSNTLSDLDFKRQKDAALFKEDILAPKEFANKRDDFRARLGMEGSLEAKEFNQRQNRAKLIESAVRDNARMAGAFGQITPINVSTMAVG